MYEVAPKATSEHGVIGYKVFDEDEVSLCLLLPFMSTSG